MSPRSPPLRFDPNNSRCLVRTYRDGSLGHLAYDIEFLVTRYCIEVCARDVRASFDPGSLRVARCMRGARDHAHELGESDKRHIEGLTIEVLGVTQHPVVTLSAALQPMADGGFVVEGQLTLNGREQRIRAESVTAGPRHVFEVMLHQPDFGIAPFQTLQGALRIRPQVSVQLALDLGPT